MEINESNKYKKCTNNCPPVFIPKSLEFKWLHSKSSTYIFFGGIFIILSIMILNKESVLKSYETIEYHTNNWINEPPQEQEDQQVLIDENKPLPEPSKIPINVWSEYQIKYLGKKGLSKKKAKKVLENYWYAEWESDEMYEIITNKTYNDQAYKVLNVYKVKKKKKYKIFYYFNDTPDEIFCDTLKITNNGITKTSEYLNEM